jgi:hypothetical protein
VTSRKQAEEVLLKAGALQKAIFNSANFSSIATDAKGVIRVARQAPYTAGHSLDIRPATRRTLRGAAIQIAATETMQHAMTRRKTSL